MWQSQEAFLVIKVNLIYWLDEEFDPKCIFPTIEYPTSVMVWGCFAAISGPGQLHVVEGMMSATKYYDVLEKVMLPSARELFHRPWLN